MTESEFIAWITTTAATHGHPSFVQSFTSSLKCKRSSSSPQNTFIVGGSSRSASSSTSSLPSGSGLSGARARAHDPELEQDLRAAFAAFDQDSNGYLSKEELRAALRVLREEELTDEELEQLMRQADKDGDGQIGIEDFFSSILPSSP